MKLPLSLPSNLFHFNKHAQSFLLLEAGLLEIKLHLVDFGQRPCQIRLLDVKPIQAGDFNALFTGISEILNTNLPVSEIAVALSSPSIHHQLASIPPLKAADRIKVLRREIRHFEAPSEAQEIVSFYSFGRQNEEGQVLERVFCAQIPRILVESILDILKAKALHPIGFTSQAQMICLMLREYRTDPNQNVALVEITEKEGGITLFRRGIWSMERRFLISAPLSAIAAELMNEQEGELDKEKLQLEIGRTLQYFKQQFRNENINQIVLYGATTRIEALTDLISNSFNIPVSLLELDTKLFDFQPAIQTAPGHSLPLYSLPCVAALHHRFRRYIDFLPSETRQEQGEGTRRHLVAGLALLLYAILGAIWFLVSHEASQLALPHLTMASVPIQDVTATHRQESLRNERTFALALLQSERWLKEKHRLVSQLVRELTEAMPPEMTVTAFEVRETPTAWDVKIKAEIASPNGSKSQDLLHTFQGRSQNSIFLKQLSLANIELGDLETVGLESSSHTGNQLTFDLNGMLPYPQAAMQPQP